MTLCIVILYEFQYTATCLAALAVNMKSQFCFFGFRKFRDCRYQTRASDNSQYPFYHLRLMLLLPIFITKKCDSMYRRQLLIPLCVSFFPFFLMVLFLHFTIAITKENQSRSTILCRQSSISSSESFRKRVAPFSTMPTSISVALKSAANTVDKVVIASFNYI
jgi:hypothetical protein